MNTITPKILPGPPPCANGYILLISVIIVGAIATSVAVALLFLSAADSKNAISHQQSEQAKATANACAEEALEQIRTDKNFTGTNSIALNNGLCTYTIANTGGQTRSIISSSTVSNVTRRLSVSVTAINPIIIMAWQETP